VTTAGPELRVLGGAHQGASVALPSLGASLTLGHDPDNDVILQDAPFCLGHLAKHGQRGFVAR